MPRLLHSRKARFESALRRCGMTQADWCEKEDIGRTQVWATLKNPKRSLRLAARIDAFISEVEEKAKAAA